MISVVIPTYRRLENVASLLESVYRQEGVPFEAIVVDDNSGDGSDAAIRNRFPKTTVLSQSVNRGPACCRNVGVRAAKGEIIVGLDSDASLIKKDTFATIEALFDSHPDVTGFAFRLFRPDGVTDDAERWWHPRPIATHATKVFVTDYFSGTAFAFRRDALISAGLFPEAFFQYYEENSVALRILDNGGVILYIPNVAVLHHAPIGRQSAMRTFYHPRNQILFAFFCYPILRGLAFAVPRVAYQGLLAIRRRTFGNFLKAMVSAASLIRSHWAERNPLRSRTWKRIALIREGTSKMAEWQC